MTEPSPASDAGEADAVAPRTAGALLKAAREREGLHVAVLAATIKVSPAKLQALEQDHYDQLPNATFTRALAQSVCRSLKIDPRPVLALLPQVESLPLEGAGARLNTPFNDRPSRSDGGGLAWASKPMFWAGGLLLLAALAVGFVPPSMLERWTSAVAPSAPAAASASASAVTATPLESAASAAAVAASSPASASALAVPEVAASAAVALGRGSTDPARPASGPVVPATRIATVAAASSPVVTPSVPSSMTPSVAPAAPSAGSGLLRLAASADSWIEVLDSQGQPVFSRILTRGEAVAVDAPPPLRVRVGNAAGTSVAFRGQSYDLGPYTRDNVARLELR